MRRASVRPPMILATVAAARRMAHFRLCVTKLGVRMFLSLVQGPESEDDFARGCAQILLPGLVDFRVTVALWTDGNDFYLQGFDDENPERLVAELAERAGWRTQTLFLRTLRNPFILPPGIRTVDCEMPYNKHAIHGGAPYKTCPTGHRITDEHQVPLCPVCSGVLA
jgi:hypothetical protein